MRRATMRRATMPQTSTCALSHGMRPAKPRRPVPARPRRRSARRQVGSSTPHGPGLTRTRSARFRLDADRSVRTRGAYRGHRLSPTVESTTGASSDLRRHDTHRRPSKHGWLSLADIESPTATGDMLLRITRRVRAVARTTRIMTRSSCRAGTTHSVLEHRARDRSTRSVRGPVSSPVSFEHEFRDQHTGHTRHTGSAGMSKRARGLATSGAGNQPRSRGRRD
jgi:hypothetical protein